MSEMNAELKEFLNELAGMEYFECEAMDYRLAEMASRGSSDRLGMPNGMKFERPDSVEDFRFSEWPAESVGYLVFSDGSLYCYTNADDEVWNDASDFVSERIIPNVESSEDLQSADAELLKYLKIEV